MSETVSPLILHHFWSLRGICIFSRSYTINFCHELTCKLKRRAPSSRSVATIRIKHRRMERRWMRCIVGRGSLADPGTLACYRSGIGRTRPGIRKANDTDAVETRPRHRMFASTSRSRTNPTILFCGCRCSVAFVFRHLQILYFLREMVLN